MACVKTAALWYRHGVRLQLVVAMTMVGVGVARAEHTAEDARRTTARLEAIRREAYAAPAPKKPKREAPKPTEGKPTEAKQADAKQAAPGELWFYAPSAAPKRGPTAKRTSS